MFKFLAGIMVGALVMSVYASTHPKETQQALKSGADTIGSVVVQGATSAQHLADQQLPQGTSPRR